MTTPTLAESFASAHQFDPVLILRAVVLANGGTISFNKAYIDAAQGIQLRSLAIGDIMELTIAPGNQEATT